MSKNTKRTTNQSIRQIDHQLPELSAKAIKFNEYVTNTNWKKAKSIYNEMLRDTIPILTDKYCNFIFSNSKTVLTNEQRDRLRVLYETVKSIVRYGNYFDLLRSKNLNNFYKNFLQKLFKRPFASKDFSDLHYDLSYVLFNFQRNRPDAYDDCVNHLDNIKIRAEELDDLETSNLVKARFWSRFFYLSYLLSVRRQEGLKAENYLALADAWEDTQFDLEEKDEADHIGYRRDTDIGIDRVFLAITRGKYKQARNLLTPIKYVIKPEDYKSHLRSLIAETVFKRCLSEYSVSSFYQIYSEASKEKKNIDSKNTSKIENDRLNLRFFHEKSLICLLLVGASTGKNKKEEYLTELKGNIGKMKRALAKFGGKHNDPVWQAQIEMLTSRMEQHSENFRNAERSASNALANANKTPLILLQIEARICLAVVLLRQNKYQKAINLLDEALDFNEENLVWDFGQFSQPDLTAAIYLYLTRIYIRKNDQRNALINFAEFKRKQHEIEHGWILNKLMPEVEREVSLSILSNKANDPNKNSIDLEMQYLLMKKEAIEDTSCKLKTHKISDIAKNLNLSPQTIYVWLRDLEERGLAPKLEKTKAKTTNKEDKLERFRQQKQEIEEASEFLNTGKKNQLANYLGISRQTLYNRLEKLEELGLSPKINGL